MQYFHQIAVSLIDLCAKACFARERAMSNMQQIRLGRRKKSELLLVDAVHEGYIVRVSLVKII